MLAWVIEFEGCVISVCSTRNVAMEEVGRIFGAYQRIPIHLANHSIVKVYTLPKIGDMTVTLLGDITISSYSIV